MLTQEIGKCPDVSFPQIHHFLLRVPPYSLRMRTGGKRLAEYLGQGHRVAFQGHFKERIALFFVDAILPATQSQNPRNIHIFLFFVFLFVD